MTTTKKVDKAAKSLIQRYVKKKKWAVSQRPVSLLTLLYY